MGYDIFSDLGTMYAAPLAAQAQEQQISTAEGQQEKAYGADYNALNPYQQAGQKSLMQLLQNIQGGAYNVNLTPQNLQNDPGYQFQMQQGMQALQRSAAAQGGLNSGAFMKAMDQYSQGLASTQYQNAWNRQMQQNQFNYGTLANMMNTGLGATGELAGLRGQFANNMSGLAAAKGNAQAAGIMGLAQGAGGALDGAMSFDMAVNGYGGGQGQSYGYGNLNAGSGVSPSSAYASNPGGYSLGNYGSQMSMDPSLAAYGTGSTPSMSGYDPSSMGMGSSPAAGGGYSLGNYGGQLIPPQMGGGY